MLLVLTALAIAAPAAFAVNEGTVNGVVTQGLDRPTVLPGTPAVNIYVYLYNATFDGVTTTPVGPPIQSTQTDATGYFEFDMVPGDSYYAVQYRETPVGTSDHARVNARWVPVWWDSVPVLYPNLIASLYNPGWDHPDPLWVPYNTTVAADAIMMAPTGSPAPSLTGSTPWKAARSTSGIRVLRPLLPRPRGLRAFGRAMSRPTP